MPDPRTLKVGETICVISVPESDRLALASGSSYLEETVRVLEWMVGKDFVIGWIDDFGIPWVDVDYPNPDGAEHTMAITDTESWVRKI